MEGLETFNDDPFFLNSDYNVFDFFEPKSLDSPQVITESPSLSPSSTGTFDESALFVEDSVSSRSPSPPTTPLHQISFPEDFPKNQSFLPVDNYKLLPVASPQPQQLQQQLPQPVETKNPKKRPPPERESRRVKKKKVIDLPPDKLILNKDELAVISSTELERRYKHFEEAGKLNEEMKEEHKKQLRLVKNRESAQASRDKKKKEMEILKEENQKLKAENRALKEQLEEFKKLSNHHLSNGQQQVHGTLPFGIPTFSGFTQKQFGYNPLQTGLFLIVLFSFAFLFQHGCLTSTKVMPNMPHIKSTPPRIFENSNYKQVSNDRHNIVIPSTHANKVWKRVTDTQPLSSKMEVDNFGLFDELDLPLSKEKSIPPPLKAQVVVPQIEFQPNTTYLLCQGISKINPPNQENTEGDDMNTEKPYISFIIPPDSDSPLGVDSDRHLQVTCQVLNVAYTPLETKKFVPFEYILD